MNTFANKTDSELKVDILSELKYEPSIRETDIGVIVKEGAVTVNGTVDSYTHKWGAIAAVRRVHGVKAIADDLLVKIPGSSQKTDGEIALAAANQINWSTTIPNEMTKITVREGFITLEGELEWWYQKNAAENAVHHLTGVKGVVNLITIKAKPDAVKIEGSMRSAFERNAILDAQKIHIETNGGNVTLRGDVRNYAEREEAERVAWAAQGVNSVDNMLTVDWA